jgi:hypothetical protein
MKIATSFFRENRFRQTILILILVVLPVLTGLLIQGKPYPSGPDPACCQGRSLSVRVTGAICENLALSLALFHPATANFPAVKQLLDFAPASGSPQKEDDSNPITVSRSPNQSASGNRRLRGVHLLQLAIVAALIFWGYSLVMSGRQGFGWRILLVSGTLFAAVIRLAGSLFNEVSADNEVGDWDDDSKSDT